MYCLVVLQFPFITVTGRLYNIEALQALATTNMVFAYLIFVSSRQHRMVDLYGSKCMIEMHR
jgi:hypothetical protein